MLVVDLDRLKRERRLVVEETLPVVGPEWEDDGARFVHLAVRLDVQQSGADVVALGRLRGQVRSVCRRCLAEVDVAVEEDVALAYQAGLTEAEAEEREVYALPARGRELDLEEAIREHALLAAPKFVVCEESCPGLCPRCGANLREAPCGCGEAGGDERWAVLRALMAER